MVDCFHQFPLEVLENVVTGYLKNSDEGVVFACVVLGWVMLGVLFSLCQLLEHLIEHHWVGEEVLYMVGGLPDLDFYQVVGVEVYRQVD